MKNRLGCLIKCFFSVNPDSHLLIGNKAKAQHLKEKSNKVIIIIEFDSWYSSKKLLHLIDGFGWKYICRAKRNRLFERVKIGNRFRHQFGCEVSKLKGVTHQILFVKNGQKFLMTNQVDLTSAEFKRYYRNRQQIEEVFRLLKKNLAGASVGLAL